MDIRAAQPALKVGTVVYGVVTPEVNSCYIPYERPHDYFVVETIIESLHTRQGGEIVYNFKTRWSLLPHWCFPTRDEAEQKLQNLFLEARRVPHTAELPFVSAADETKGDANMTKKVQQRSVDLSKLPWAQQ
jgi:hypothetical protein